jgi:hypothetical protein
MLRLHWVSGIIYVLHLPEICCKLSEAPADTDLMAVWECLDSELPLLTIEQQLKATSECVCTSTSWRP